MPCHRVPRLGRREDAASAVQLSYHVPLPNLFQDAGASENYLRNTFAALLTRGKASILILDEIDMIASKRSSRKGQSKRALFRALCHSLKDCLVAKLENVASFTGVEAKLFATLLHLVDSINLSANESKIFIIGNYDLVPD